MCSPKVCHVSNVIRCQIASYCRPAPLPECTRDNPPVSIVARSCCQHQRLHDSIVWICKPGCLQATHRVRRCLLTLPPHTQVCGHGSCGIGHGILTTACEPLRNTSSPPPRLRHSSATVAQSEAFRRARGAWRSCQNNVLESLHV